ncbi:hypothetical protein [Streptomyces sp. NPDC001492]
MVTLAGDPVQGAVLGDGTILTGPRRDLHRGPTTGWLKHTGLANRLGVDIDDTCFDRCARHLRRR